MKRFIDLTDQINDGEKEFAFYCTVKNRFDTFGGSQKWDSINSFTRDYQSSQDFEGNELERYLALIPDGFFNTRTWGDCTVTINGKEIEGIRSVLFNKVIGISDLEMDLRSALDDEDYEFAAKIKKKIDELKNNL